MDGDGPARVARVHRTTTTAALLVTVAVSALTGCTTVQGPPSADPSAAGAHASAPHPDSPVDPRAVQAPAREALEMIGPSQIPGHASGKPRGTTPPAAPPPPRPPAAGAGQQPLPGHPEAPKGAEGARPPLQVPKLPGTSGKDTGKNADVCSLGKKYGGWRPGSPEARICDQAYGN